MSPDPQDGQRPTPDDTPFPWIFALSLFLARSRLALLVKLLRRTEWTMDLERDRQVRLSLMPHQPLS